MPSPNFTQTPRFQSALRRRMNVDPRQNAIPQIDDLVADFSREEAEKEEYGRGRAASLEMGAKKLGLDQRRIGFGEQRLDLSRKRFDIGKEQTAAGIDMTRDMMGIQKSQNKWATGIGVGNVALEAGGAVLSGQAADRDILFRQKIADSMKIQQTMVEAFMKELPPRKTSGGK